MRTYPLPLELDDLRYNRTAGGRRMYKLVILVEPPENQQELDEAWPQYLHQVEQMPGLRRETISRVDQVLYGKSLIYLIHELHFDSLESIHQAMASPQGQAAGALLQRMTGGRVTLLLADHKEDDLENILRFRSQSSHAP